MSFNSLTYLWFLPLVFALYWTCGRTGKLQNLIILVSSLVFYGWFDWHFLILISITILSSYVTGLGVDRYLYREGGKRTAWWCVFANVAINLGILFYFKYFNFFIDSFSRVAGFVGLHLDIVTRDIILPIGISFYTFQAISYTVDIYRGRIRAKNNFILLSAYIIFFPQLLAGPIEKASQLLPQFKEKRTFDVNMANDGMRQILWGFFQKLVIADNCALVTYPLLQGWTGDYSGLELYLILICFCFQIYGDFAGYADIAIGSAKLFGIRLTRNFHVPMFSRNVLELWNHWHISLNNWFFDYVLLPLGGMRNKWRFALNTIFVFILSGIWHGARMTYVCWGLNYGIVTAIYSLMRKKRNRKKKTPYTGYNRMLPSFSEFLGIFITIGFITALNIALFASPSMHSAIQLYYDLFTRIFWTSHHLSQFKTPIVLILLLNLFQWTQRANKQHDFQLDFLPHRWQRYIVYFMVIIAIGYFYVDTTQFIYFQF